MVMVISTSQLGNIFYTAENLAIANPRVLGHDIVPKSILAQRPLAFTMQPNISLWSVKSFAFRSKNKVRPEEIFTAVEGDLAKSYQARFVSAHSTLSPDSSLYQQIESSVKKLSKIAGLPEDLFKLTIFRRDMPNADGASLNFPDAHILPAIAQLNLSEKLFDVLDNRLDLVESVIAHEIGHYLQAIYRFENGVASNPMGNNYIVDPTEMHIQSYDEEYQADRVSINLMSMLGKNPNLISVSLDKIESFYRKNDEEQKVRQYSNEDYRLPWVFNTHPHSTRRITTNKRIARLLPNNPYEVTKLESSKVGDWRKPFLLTKISDLPTRITEFWWSDRSMRNGESAFIALGRTQNFDQALEGMIQVGETLTKLEATYVNTLEANDILDTEAVARWWQDATLALCNQHSLKDLKSDISEYSLDTIKQLLAKLNQYSIYQEEFSRSSDKRIPYVLAAHLLTEEWYREVSDFDKPQEQVDEIIDLLKVYKSSFDENGMDCPDNLFFPMKLANEIFENLSDEDKNKLATAIETNFQYLTPSVDLLNDDGLNIRNKRLDILKDIPVIAEWLKSQGRELILPESEYKLERPKILEAYDKRLALESKALELVNKIKENEHCDETTKPSVKEFLTEECASLFKNPLLTVSLAAGSKNYNKGTLADSLAFHSSSTSVYLVSTEEFEKSYFGISRNEHDQIDYTLVEHDNKLPTYINFLWEKVFRDDFEGLASPVEKLKFLDGSFGLSSMYRDQLISEAIGLSSLNFSSDVTQVQNDLMKLTNFEELELAQRMFKNPALKMTCSFRISELLGIETENLIGNDKASINKELLNENDYLSRRFNEVSRTLREIKNFPEEFITPDFVGIVFSYPNSCYKRDDLLKPWIDSAGDEKSKLAVASLLTEPPISAPGLRKTQQILVTETLYDIFSKLGRIDKEETLLYLLGHREFSSGIDAQFDKRYTMGSLYNRELALYGDSTVAMEGLNWIPSSSEDRYSRPDGIVELTKNCGCPPETIFEQHKITSTERERLEAIDFLLRGHDGILNSRESKQRFMGKAAALILDRFKENNTLEKPEDFQNLLEHLLNNCPEDKISKLFLDIWDLSTNKITTLPNLMTQLIRSYGPVMVKFGQFLSTQDLPKDWKDEFRGLCSDNSTADSTLIYSYTSSAFDENPFQNFGKKIKEGSIAATYEADVITDQQIILRNTKSQRVAVKIYHPFIANELDEDISFIESIVEYLRRNKEIFGFVLPANSPELIKRMMLQQIDPKQEIIGSKDLKAHISRELGGVRFVVPSLIEEASSNNILSYEFDTGIELDKESELAKVPLLAGQGAKLRHAVGLEVLRQILFEGVYQADPNLGNFVAREPKPNEKQDKPVVVWHDPGDIGYISQEDRERFLKLIRLFSNPKKINWDLVIDNFTGFLDSEDKNHAAQMLKVWVENNVENMRSHDFEKSISQFIEFCESNNLSIKQDCLNVISTLKKLKPLIYDYSNLPSDLRTLFIRNKLQLWI
jgi:predicted unusual protein kinase regulating ubiquinone biosynthesis (AarF/ABC1/UbiB family)/Zn-dependent protease with chaperone function